MFLFAFFRASSHSSLAPTVEIGGIWPPKGIGVLDPREIPFLNNLFLTVGPVEVVATVPTESTFLLIPLKMAEPFAIFFLYNIIIIPLIIVQMKREPLVARYFKGPAFRTIILFFVSFVVVFQPVTAFCEPAIESPPVEFYPAPPAEAEVPAPPSPPPPPPVIPELPQPLIPDPIRRQELAAGVGLQFLGRNTWEDVTRQMDILHMRMLLETRVEAALIGDGCRAEDLIRKRFEVRDVLFYKRGGEPLAAQTLRRYLSEIDNTGTRSSVPYRRVVRAIQNSDICL
jgi:hypothetical protein